MATMEKRWMGATDPAEINDDFPRYHGKLAFDIGANIGQVAHMLAPNFDRVISFEPCAESFAILEAEVPGNVTCLPVAVSDHTGTVTLHEAQQSIKTGQLVTREGLHWGPLVGSRELECRTLDSVADEYGMPDFVKVDTEGHELQVIEGGESVLKSGPRWLVEMHGKDDGDRIYEILTGHGYQVEQVGYMRGRPGSIVNHHWWTRAWK